MTDKQAANGELSFIGHTTVIEGTIKTDGSIRVDGKVIGDLHAKANAAVGERGIVEGTVTARNISLSGKVKGSVTALEKLVLEEKAILHGDIRTARLVVDEGAMFDGQCAMTGQSAPPKAG
jgi:cytoskeletal protein CcmA (bactofilin family)